MATIQNGDLIYVRSVLGLPYGFLIGETAAGTVTMGEVIGEPNTRWQAHAVANGGWVLECQGDNGMLRILDSDAEMNVNLDDDPADASTHWDLIQTATPGRWQIRSRSYGHYLNGSTAAPTVASDGTLESTHWELLLIAI